MRSKLGTTLGSTSRIELRQASCTKHGSVTESSNGEVLGLLVESKLEKFCLLILCVKVEWIKVTVEFLVVDTVEKYGCLLGIKVVTILEIKSRS